MNSNKFSQILRKCERVAILVPNFTPYAGDARVVEIQAEDLTKEGKDITIFTFRNDMESQFHVVTLGMPESLALQGVYRLIFPINFMKVVGCLRELREYDLIISHLYPMNWLGFLSKLLHRKIYVFWYHGIPPPRVYPHLYERFYIRLFIELTKITIRNADLIVSVSEWARNELKNYTGKDSIVIYNKLNPNRILEAKDPEIARKKLGLGDEPVILYVGRICPQKGVDTLLEVFYLIKKEIPSAKLIIVGEHTYKYYSKKLQSRCGNDASITFTGFVSDDDLLDYYAACDLYVTCSLYETFNLPLAEAQSLGKPVVAFDIGPHSEIIDGRGMLIEKGNISKFADACIKFLTERISQDPTLIKSKDNRQAWEDQA